MRGYEPEELTKDEQILITEIFKNPTLIKYLTILQRTIGDDILTRLPSTSDIDDAAFRRQLILEQGKLLILDTLLSIKEQQ